MTATPAQIIVGLEEKNRLLSQKNTEYAAIAEKRAQAERDYKMMVREQTLRHKSDGHPATLIPTLVSGHRSVADLKFELDVATETQKACLESIKDTRSQIETYRSLLTWLRAEMTGGQ